MKWSQFAIFFFLSFVRQDSQYQLSNSRHFFSHKLKQSLSCVIERWLKSKHYTNSFNVSDDCEDYLEQNTFSYIQEYLQCNLCANFSIHEKCLYNSVGHLSDSEGDFGPVSWKCMNLKNRKLYTLGFEMWVKHD